MKRSPEDQVCATKKQCIEGGILSTNNSAEQERPHNYREDALYNYVVLRNIFLMLQGKDVQTFCHVSQYWRAVADPLVSLYYDITLGTNIWDSDYAPFGSHKAVIKAKDKYNHKIFTTYESTFDGVTKILEQVLRTQRISISLKIFGTTSIRSDRVKNFFAKFGPLVQHLAIDGVATLPLNTFCQILLTNLPNLRQLNCTGLELQDFSQDGNFNPDLPKNKHRHLRKIIFAYNNAHCCSFQSLETILKIAPNLEEIQDLPLHLVNALVIAQKGQLIKSVSYRHDTSHLMDENEETFVSAFQKLAQLQPKLREFSLLRQSTFPMEDENSYAMVKPLIFAVLESSTYSLESLCIFPTEFYGFQNFPPLAALNTLKFRLDHYPVDEGVFFPMDISLMATFPNVIRFQIGFPLKENFLNEYLPENIISPWGIQIKALLVEWLPLNALPMIQRRFPSVQELKLLATPEGIGQILPALDQFWSKLISLTIGGNYGWVETNTLMPGVLDCAFTGLSEYEVNELLDPSRRENFTDEEIQQFKDQSPIKKLKELRELKFIVRNSEDGKESVKTLTTLTPLANEFGFSLLPNLKVTMGIWRYHHYAEAIKTILKPLANIFLEEYYFDGEWPQN